MQTIVLHSTGEPEQLRLESKEQFGKILLEIEG